MEVSDEEHDQQFTPLKVSVFVQTLLHLGELSSLSTKCPIKYMVSFIEKSADYLIVIDFVVTSVVLVEE